MALFHTWLLLIRQGILLYVFCSTVQAMEILNEQDRDITSENYPKPYPPNLNSTWMSASSSSKSSKWAVVFLEFHLDPLDGRFHDSDSLELDDGHNPVRYSASSQPSRYLPYKTTGHYLRMTFITDQRTSNKTRGFKVHLLHGKNDNEIAIKIAQMGRQTTQRATSGDGQIDINLVIIIAVVVGVIIIVIVAALMFFMCRWRKRSRRPTDRNAFGVRRNSGVYHSRNSREQETTSELVIISRQITSHHDVPASQGSQRDREEPNRSINRQDSQSNPNPPRWNSQRDWRARAELSVQVPNQQSIKRQQSQQQQQQKQQQQHHAGACADPNTFDDCTRKCRKTSQTSSASSCSARTSSPTKVMNLYHSDQDQGRQPSSPSSTTPKMVMMMMPAEAQTNRRSGNQRMSRATMDPNVSFDHAQRNSYINTSYAGGETSSHMYCNSPTSPEPPTYCNSPTSREPQAYCNSVTGHHDPFRLRTCSDSNEPPSYFDVISEQQQSQSPGYSVDPRTMPQLYCNSPTGGTVPYNNQGFVFNQRLGTSCQEGALSSNSTGVVLSQNRGGVEHYLNNPRSAKQLDETNGNSSSTKTSGYQGSPPQAPPSEAAQTFDVSANANSDFLSLVSPPERRQERNCNKQSPLDVYTKWDDVQTECTHNKKDSYNANNNGIGNTTGAHSPLDIKPAPSLGRFTDDGEYPYLTSMPSGQTNDQHPTQLFEEERLKDTEISNITILNNTVDHSASANQLEARLQASKPLESEKSFVPHESLPGNASDRCLTPSDKCTQEMNNDSTNRSKNEIPTIGSDIPAPNDAVGNYPYSGVTTASTTTTKSAVNSEQGNNDAIGKGNQNELKASNDSPKTASKSLTKQVAFDLSPAVPATAKSFVSLGSSDSNNCYMTPPSPKPKPQIFKKYSKDNVEYQPLRLNSAVPRSRNASVSSMEGEYHHLNTSIDNHGLKDKLGHANTHFHNGFNTSLDATVPRPRNLSLCSIESGYHYLPSSSRSGSPLREHQVPYKEIPEPQTTDLNAAVPRPRNLSVISMDNGYHYLPSSSRSGSPMREHQVVFEESPEGQPIDLNAAVPRPRNISVCSTDNGYQYLPSSRSASPMREHQVPYKEGSEGQTTDLNAAVPRPRNISVISMDNGYHYLPSSRSGSPMREHQVPYKEISEGQPMDLNAAVPRPRNLSVCSIESGYHYLPSSDVWSPMRAHQAISEDRESQSFDLTSRVPKSRNASVSSAEGEYHVLPTSGVSSPMEAHRVLPEERETQPMDLNAAVPRPRNPSVSSVEGDYHILVGSGMTSPIKDERRQVNLTTQVISEEGSEC